MQGGGGWGSPNDFDRGFDRNSPGPGGRQDYGGPGGFNQGQQGGNINHFGDQPPQGNFNSPPAFGDAPQFDHRPSYGGGQQPPMQQFGGQPQQFGQAPPPTNQPPAFGQAQQFGQQPGGQQPYGGPGGPQMGQDMGKGGFQQNSMQQGGMNQGMGGGFQQNSMSPGGGDFGKGGGFQQNSMNQGGISPQGQMQGGQMQNSMNQGGQYPSRGGGAHDGGQRDFAPPQQPGGSYPARGGQQQQQQPPQQQQQQQQQEQQGGQQRERRPSVVAGSEGQGGLSEDAFQRAMCYSVDLLSYLAIMDYETHFCHRQHKEPINQFSFALPGQPSVQFNNFSALCGWLFSQLGHQATWHDGDDPTTVANEIMLLLRSTVGEVDFPSGKLRTGFGDAVCYTLSALAKQAAAKIKLAAPQFGDEAVGEELYTGEGAEEDDVLDEVEEDEISEEEPMYAQPVEQRDTGESSGAPDSLTPAAGQEEETIGQPKFDESTIDPQQWALELERVGPQLRIDNEAVTRDLWRSHIDKLEGTLKNQDDFESVKLGLRGCNGELSEILSKIKMAENRVGQFKGAKKIKEDRIEVMRLNEQIEMLQDEVDDRNDELRKINERKEQLQGNLDDRTKDASDTGPLQKMKETMETLKNEMKQMDLRIGVVTHTLMQAQAQHYAKNRPAPGRPNPSADDFMVN